MIRPVVKDAPCKERPLFRERSTLKSGRPLQGASRASFTTGPIFSAPLYNLFDCWMGPSLHGFRPVFHHDLVDAFANSAQNQPNVDHSNCR